MTTIASQIWNKKYRFENEATVEDTWRRVAKALSVNEPEWEDRFYAALEGYKFLPAGRITAGAGTGRAVTLANCFVMGTIPDSIPGIFDALKEAALTMQQGGGIGYDFSTIRPKGAFVKGVSADASGPLSFMDVWDAMCRTIMSAGSRRGAMMSTLRCDHPDIEAFIIAKQDPVKLRMFNMSVLVTDPFMAAVKAGGSWDLVFDGKVYQTVQARDLWDKIMKSTYDFAEPGVIFIDRVNASHNLWYLEKVATTNPCGEKPMGPYASCLLGSINLARLVRDPFTPAARLDMVEMRSLVEVAIRMMDNVIDVSLYPLESQRLKAEQDRQLGLGVTGLADALLMLGIRYGNDKAVLMTSQIMDAINEAAYMTSVDLAKERGSFETFDAEKFLAGGFMRSMHKDVVDLIRVHGIRNSLLTSIAPTGTISLYADNVSSGIEPIFAPVYTRKVLQDDGSKVEEEVVDYAVQMWRDLKGDKSLPPNMVDAQTLSPADHIRMQAAAQRWVDSSISKTTNCPEDITFEAFQDIYMQAYDQGCKGCTTYRPNAVTGSVLSVTPTAPGLPPREGVLEGKTYKLKWPESEHALYITINDLEGAPHEVFINSKNTEHFAWTVALTRMISAVYRRGGDVSFVAEELKSVFDPRGGAWMGGKYVPSLLAAIGDVIQKHTGSKNPSHPQPGQNCPKCSGANFRTQSGCGTCGDCGYSKCG